MAVYARISQDRTGEELGIRRQLADCRAEADRRGWVVAEEYVDDDVSAYSGKKRPAFERMLTDLAEGRRPRPPLARHRPLRPRRHRLPPTFRRQLHHPRRNATSLDRLATQGRGPPTHPVPLPAPGLTPRVTLLFQVKRPSPWQSNGRSAGRRIVGATPPRPPTATLLVVRALQLRLTTSSPLRESIPPN